MNPFRVALFAAMVVVPAYLFGGSVSEAAQRMIGNLRALVHGEIMPMDLWWGIAFAVLYAGTMVALWKSAGRIEAETRHNPKAILSRLYTTKLIVLFVMMALMTPIGFVYGFAQATAAAFMLALAIWLALDGVLVLIGLGSVVIG